MLNLNPFILINKKELYFIVKNEHWQGLTKFSIFKQNLLKKMFNSFQHRFCQNF